MKLKSALKEFLFMGKLRRVTLVAFDLICFAMVDLGLYLDVNPNNQEMIKLFNQYREEKENLTKEYESKYGPITPSSDSLNSYPWAWNKMPWPWDN